MSRDGPASNSLSRRLSAKLEADRKLIEELTLHEHRKLAQNFLDASKAELDTIRSAIQDQSRTTAQALHTMLRWPLWTAAVCTVIVLSALTLLWAMTWWLRQDLAEIRTVTLQERQALTNLRDQTGGVRVMRNDKGLFLILPKGAETGWKCADEPCVKMPAGK